MFIVKSLKRMRHTCQCCDCFVLTSGTSSHSQHQWYNDVFFHVFIFIFVEMNEVASPVLKQGLETQSTLDKLFYQIFVSVFFAKRACLKSLVNQRILSVTQPIRPYLHFPYKYTKLIIFPPSFTWPSNIYMRKEE